MTELLPRWMQPSALMRFSRDAQLDQQQHEGKQRDKGEGPSRLSSQPPRSSSSPTQLFDLQDVEGCVPVDDLPRHTLSEHLNTLTALTFALGFGTGLYSSANRARLVFMAENAHRRPETVQGWYFYNKTKNYKVLLSGVQGGFKTGVKLSAFVLAFLTLDQTLCAMRYRLSRYASNLKNDRRALPSPGRGSSGDSSLDMAVETVQTSLESIKALATGQLDTTPPEMNYPLTTYRTQEDVAQLGADSVEGVTYSTVDDVRLIDKQASNGAVSWKRPDAQDVEDERTYDTARDLQQLGALQRQAAAPWWSEEASRQRQQIGNRWIDGGCAGGIMALLTVVAYRLPGKASVRTVGLGVAAGSTLGLLREAQQWLRKAREESDVA